jgi:hypothetical protein
VALEKLHVLAILSTGQSPVNIPHGTELCISSTGEGSLKWTATTHRGKFVTAKL